jgi:inner membrane protein
MEFRQVDVSTDVLTPIFWKVIVDEGDMYHIGGLNLLKLHEPLSLTRFQKAHYAVFRKFGKAMSLFKTYAWFFDYPVMTTEKSENKTMITLSDLRFATTVPFIQNHMNDRGLPFAITAILDNRQKLIGYYYNSPRQSKETEYLE